MIEHAIERLTDVDDVGIRNEDIADEQLLFWRQSEAGIERALEVAIGQHADQRAAILHREMTNLVLDHEGAGRQHTVIDLHHARKWCHDRTDRGDMVHAQGLSPNRVIH